MKPPATPLPPVHKPRHEEGDRPCSKCFRSLRDRRDHWRCEMFNGQLCTFMRDETGECGPDALYWKAKA